MDNKNYNEDSIVEQPEQADETSSLDLDKKDAFVSEDVTEEIDRESKQEAVRLDEADLSYEIQISRIQENDQDIEHCDLCASVQGEQAESAHGAESERRVLSKKSRKIMSVLSWVVISLLAVCCGFMIYGNFAYSDIYEVSGQSMTITLIEGSGDSATVSHYGYLDGSVVYTNDSQVKRQDVVILKAYSGTFLIKRIIGLGGDRIWLDNGIVVVQSEDGEITKLTHADGVELSAISPGKQGNLRDTTQSEPFIVPQGFLYYMGDNRNNSTDSRDRGAIPLSDVQGNVAGYIPDWYRLVLEIRRETIILD